MPKCRSIVWKINYTSWFSCTSAFQSHCGLGFEWATATRNADSFLFSAIQLDLRCCEWKHCPIAWLSLGQTLSITQTASHLIRILWYKENVMVYSITTRCPGSAATKQNRIIIFCHCATTQNLWHEVFVLIWSVPFQSCLNSVRLWINPCYRYVSTKVAYLFVAYVLTVPKGIPS